MGFSTINHPIWGTPIDGTLQMIKIDLEMFALYVGLSENRVYSQL